LGRGTRGEGGFYVKGCMHKCIIICPFPTMSLFRYKEVCNYDFARHRPKNKRKVTGHFTQLVWKTSLKFGIGKAKSKNGCTYAVAHYKKPGNYEGETGRMFSREILFIQLSVIKEFDQKNCYFENIFNFSFLIQDLH
jgi:hypothetical protein